MTESLFGPWWGREAPPTRKARIVAGMSPIGVRPELLASKSGEMVELLQALAPAYVPEWTNRRADDAGVALCRLFAELSQSVRERVNQLPEKAFVEFLNQAGIRLEPATPASALLEFTVSDSAPGSSLVPEGFQVTAAAADGSGEIVVFETGTSFYAAPGKIESLVAQDGTVFREVDLDATSFLPFGADARLGRSLVIGLSSPVEPGPRLSIGIELAASAGLPAPVALGGVLPTEAPAPPLLVWEVLDGSTYEAAEVVSDGTAGLTRSGIVELELPDGWRTGVPIGFDGDELRWLRLRLSYGTFTTDPEFSAVRLNVVMAVAARTIRNEVLLPVSTLPADASLLALSRTPVIPGTLELVVEGEGIEGNPVTWSAVDDLALYGPEDRVYVLEPETGVVMFGDGIHGASLPPGFRHVTAVRYQVGGGQVGAVDAEEIGALLSSAPFVTGVNNPLRASGGVDQETLDAAVDRGPQDLRARGRAVTVADYELLARRAPGAQVVRAHAVSGHHPARPGRPIPGVVGIYVVPPDIGAGAPVADSQTLTAVSVHLTESVAPYGVEVVAAAVTYHTVRIEAAAIIDPAYGTAEVVTALLTAINEYLHPITGGEDGNGWPFGGPILHRLLLRRLMLVDGALAVPRLNMIVDGRRYRSCEDYSTPRHDLVWPGSHEIVPLAVES